MVKKYRKKPVVVEAIYYTGFNKQEILDFAGTKATLTNEDNIIIIYTLEGNMKARVNDWIIKGVKGEFYPCKLDIFKQTYEEV